MPTAGRTAACSAARRRLARSVDVGARRLGWAVSRHRSPAVVDDAWSWRLAADRGPVRRRRDRSAPTRGGRRSPTTTITATTQRTQSASITASPPTAGRAAAGRSCSGRRRGPCRARSLRSRPPRRRPRASWRSCRCCARRRRRRPARGRRRCCRRPTARAPAGTASPPVSTTWSFVTPRASATAPMKSSSTVTWKSPSLVPGRRLIARMLRDDLRVRGRLVAVEQREHGVEVHVGAVLGHHARRSPARRRPWRTAPWRSARSSGPASARSCR